ncbi:MAG: CCA tRNA nucleotidyltransferase [Firmicutes bacterium]|nr:CCA tRNA nucleotidyltransferase [Bacillota bacterium]
MSGDWRLRRALRRRIPRPVEAVMRTLETAGHPAFVAGASARDLLFGREPEAWEIATDAVPRKVMAVFPGAEPLTPFVTAVPAPGATVRVATYRMEADPSEGPEMPRFAPHIYVDLAHRDFTIEAVAVSRRGELEDPFQGYADVLHRRLRAVGEPELRFRERPSRMLRAIALAAEFNLNYHRPLLLALQGLRQLIDRVPAEAIREEWARMLLSPRPAYAMEALLRTGILHRFCPELAALAARPAGSEEPPALWEHTMRVLEAVPPILELRLAALFHDAGAASAPRRPAESAFLAAWAARGALRRLGFGEELVAAVEGVVRHHEELRRGSGLPPERWQRWAERLGPRVAGLVLAFRRAHLSVEPSAIEAAAWQQAIAALGAEAEPPQEDRAAGGKATRAGRSG